MREYFFYRHNDKAKEALGVLRAESRLDAIEKFALVKKLDIGEFTKLFEVEEKRG